MSMELVSHPWGSRKSILKQCVGISICLFQTNDPEEHCMHACSVVSNSLWSHELMIPPDFSVHLEFSRQEYWSGLPFLTPGDLPDPGIKPTFLASPVLAGRFLTWEALRNLAKNKERGWKQPGYTLVLPILFTNQVLCYLIFWLITYWCFSTIISRNSITPDCKCWNHQLLSWKHLGQVQRTWSWASPAHPLLQILPSSLQLVRASMWPAPNNWVRMGVREVCCGFLAVKGEHISWPYRVCGATRASVDTAVSCSLLPLVCYYILTHHLHIHAARFPRERATRSVECLNIMIAMSHVSFWKKGGTAGRRREEEGEVIHSGCPPSNLLPLCIISFTPHGNSNDNVIFLIQFVHSYLIFILYWNHLNYN